MKGLIFNLLAELATDAGCEDEAWEVALAAANEPLEGGAAEDLDVDEPSGAYEFPSLFGESASVAPVWGWSPPPTDAAVETPVRPEAPEQDSALVPFRIKLAPDHPHFGLMMAWMFKT